MNLVNVVDEGDDGDGDAERDVVEEPQENEHFSDTTVSANGSDDDDGEGSTAATDGGSNLMRASPAEQVILYLLVLKVFSAIDAHK